MRHLFHTKKPEPQAGFRQAGDTVPRGLSHSVIPQAYLDQVKDNWDRDNTLYTNKIIINNPYEQETNKLDA